MSQQAAVQLQTVEADMASTVLPDIEGFDSSQLQQILNDLDSQTVKAGKAKLPPISFSSEDERLKLEQGLHKAKRALIDVKRLEATSHLVHGDFDAAAVEAGRALKLSLDVFGPGKIELVSCHLLLAEANLGLGRQKFTAEYLARANWCILKNPDCSNRLKSQLYRNFGKLYASQGKYDESLRQLANDIYFSSLQSGPEHVDTAGGYYYMATVFYLQSKIDSALGMCDKVVEIWMKEGKKSIPTALSEPQVMEGVQVISKIVVLREEALGIDHVATGEACFVLGLLYNHAKEPGKARGLIGKASKIYQQELGVNHPTTMDCFSRLQSLGANAGSSAPSHSGAATSSTPDPQMLAASVHGDRTAAAAVLQNVHSTVTAPDFQTAVAEPVIGAAAATIPSSSDPDAVPDGETALGNGDEAISSVVPDGESALGNGEEAISSVVPDGESALGNGDEAISSVVPDGETAVGNGEEAISVVDASAEVASVETPAIVESVAAVDSGTLQSVHDAADASASVDQSVAPTEGASDDNVAAHTNGSSELTADVVATIADATSELSSQPALTVEGGDAAAVEGLPVNESNGQDGAASASADTEKSEA